MSPQGCPFGLCDDDSCCRYCDAGGRTRMASTSPQDAHVACVDAKREQERAQERERNLHEECNRLARRNVALVIECDKLRDEVSMLRRAVAPGHLQAQIAMLTYENEQLRQRSLNVALYEGEG